MGLSGLRQKGRTKRRRRQGAGARDAAHVLDVPRIVQPDAVSCGPTCLAQVLEHWGVTGSLPRLVTETRRTDGGGTLAVFLGLEALRLGFAARIWSYDTRVLDPTWFRLGTAALARKLRARARHVRDAKLLQVTLGYEEFLAAGGEVAWKELTPRLLVSILNRGRPILTGLNATYLYRDVRERPEDGVDDDVRGEPVGHFVVLCGYRRGGASFDVRDPSTHVPRRPSGRYVVDADRLINSILLGDNTYDDVLLEIWPGRVRRRAR